MNILNDKSDQVIARQNDIEQVQQEKQEFKLLGTYYRTAGLNLYCYNPHKDKVGEVEVKKQFSDLYFNSFRKRVFNRGLRKTKN